MHLNQRTIGALALAAMLSLPAAAAGGEGWKLPSLNPFGGQKQRKKATVAATVTDGEPGGWSLPSPKLPTFSLPSWGRPSGAPTTRSQPTTWQKMNRGAKNLMQKTTETLTPWKKASGPAKPPTQMNPTSKKKAGFFSSWLPKGDEPEENKIETVGDFLALPRE